MDIRILGAISLIGALPGCHTIRPEPFLLDAPFLVAFSSTFAERIGDDSVGTMTLALRVSPDSVVGIIKGFYHDSLTQFVMTRFEPRSLRLIQVRDSGTSAWEELTYGDRQLRGMSLIQNRRGAFDTVHLNRPIDSLTVDRRSLLTIVPWLPLTTGRVFTLRIYDPTYHTVYPVLITVTEKVPIAVPAGRFEAHRVMVTTQAPKWVGSCGGLFPTVLWIRADGSRQIIRVERPTQRAIYNLINTAAQE